jgi:hypothetical protein
VTDAKTFVLVEELATVLNRASRENESNTPDFILAEYLNLCLEAFERTSRRREEWYGKELSIDGIRSRGPATTAPTELQRLDNDSYFHGGKGPEPAPDALLEATLEFIRTVDKARDKFAAVVARKGE